MLGMGQVCHAEEGVCNVGEESAAMCSVWGVPKVLWGGGGGAHGRWGRGACVGWGSVRRVGVPCRSAGMCHTPRHARGSVPGVAARISEWHSGKVQGRWKEGAGQAAAVGLRLLRRSGASTMVVMGKDYPAPARPASTD